MIEEPKNYFKVKFSHQELILALIVLIFLADGANSILLNTGSSFYKISIYIRLLAQVYFLYLLSKNRSGRQVWLFVGFFYFVFLVGTLAGLGHLYTINDYDLAGNFRVINKMVFFFICFETFKQYLPEGLWRQRLFSIFEILLLIQSFVIIISFVFNIKIFAAYLQVSDGAVRIRRFGYQGLIPAQNEIAGFFILAFFYFLTKVVLQKKSILPLLITTLAAILTGTKVTLILPLILVVYLAMQIIRRLIVGKINRLYLYLAVALAIISVVALWQRDFILAQVAPTVSYYSYRVNQGLSSSIFDAITAPGRRNKIIGFFSTYLPNYKGLNYLFGGHDLISFATESDLIDIFARLGLIGGLVFYFFYVKVLLYPKPVYSFLRILFVLLWLLVSTVAGHLAYTAINAIYLSILILFFASVEFKLRENVRERPALIKDNRRSANELVQEV